MTGVLICAEQSDSERTHDTDTGNNSPVRHHDSQSVSACTVQQMSVVTQSSVTKHHKYQQTPPPLLQWQLAGLLETYTARVFLRCWIFFHSKEGVQKLPALYLEFLKLPDTGSLISTAAVKAQSRRAHLFRPYFWINGLTAHHDLWWSFSLIYVSRVLPSWRWQADAASTSFTWIYLFPLFVPTGAAALTVKETQRRALARFLSCALHRKTTSLNLFYHR